MRRFVPASSVVIIAVAVFLAILIDLVCGLHKAKKRGEKRNSFALSRTITKFRERESAIFLATMMDVIIDYSNVFALLLQPLKNVPVCTCVVGVFLLIVEFVSVRENADDSHFTTTVTSHLILNILFYIILEFTPSKLCCIH